MFAHRMDETRKERAERVARTVMEQLGLKMVAKVDAGGSAATWRLTLYGERLIEIEFETHPSDENMLE
jgi:hypothetical protein